jgi:hypothetical protein
VAAADFLTAILGGSVATALAVAGRSLAIPSEVRANDADVAERDDALATWVADRHHALGMELRGIRNTLAAQGQQTAGTFDTQLAHAKAQALHEYRDEARRATRDVALIRAREGSLHRAWRLRRQPFPALATPEKAQPVLNTWRRASGEVSSDRPTPVEDATARTLDGVIAGLTATSP